MQLSSALQLLGICVLLHFGTVLSQSIEDEFNNPCNTITTCGECITTSRLCAWCGSEEVPRDFTRCDLAARIKANCKAADITNPVTTQNPDKDADWTSGDPNSPPVQVKPQEMTVNIRPSDPINFKLKFRQQANYPVDLYFLLDLTFGMYRQTEARNRLIALGGKIRDSMIKITNNYKLGFGTFVDKTLMPYIAWTKEMFNHRCPLTSCESPHDYRHQLKLGEDNQAFASKMTQAMESISQSLDDAESGMDGLIQALDCDKKVGWRQVSRRIIVYSSNSLFHLAGAGRLGGATKQSNLECDLNAKNEYAGEKIYDYPSVSQIADKLREKNANVIFAVMSNVTAHYKLLKGFLDGAVVGELEEDSDNIVQLIQDKYYELRSQIQFKPTNADDIDITLKSKCRGNVLKETYRCENLGIDEEVEFDVKLSVSKDICSGKKGIVSKRIALDAVGLNEQLAINLNVMCSCPCETPAKPNRAKCRNAGVLECGICNCDAGRYGKDCKCDETTLSNEESLENCRMKKNESTICSGNGECICGDCNCFPISASNEQDIYSGVYCNCNDFNCPRGKDRKPCAGRGTCKCSKCDCISEWSGPTCECSTNNETCMASNGLLCNGNGECRCGKCYCTAASQKYGPTCEDCDECEKQCNEYRACAQCKAHKSGTYDLDECTQYCEHTVVKDDLPSGKGVRKCEGEDVDGCTFFFTYGYSPENNVVVTSQQTKDCPKKANLGAIIGGTVAAVVLIPLLIICLIVIIRNRRDAKEYADFMRERERAQWDSTSNPIYKDPKSSFQNPTYKGGKK